MNRYDRPAHPSAVEIADAGFAVGHINNLTGVRAAAALWVLIYHFRESPVVEQVNLGPVAAYGYLGVDVFFVLSGFILSWNYASSGRGLLERSAFRRFVVKRFARIYPLHLVTFLLFVALWALGRAADYTFSGETAYTPWSAIVNVANLHAWGLTDETSWNGPSWSISAEWFAYIVVFPLTLLLFTHRKLRVPVAATTAGWLALAGYLALAKDGDLNQLTTFGIIRIIPEFLAGYALYRVVDGQQSWRHADRWFLAGLVVMGFVLFDHPATVLLVLPAILLIIFGLFAGGPLTDRLFSNRVSVFLGEISYSMYMVHAFVQLVANQILRRTDIDGVAAGLGALAAMLGLTIIAAWFVYRYLEIPARRWLVRYAEPVSLLQPSRS